ncbi:MAG: NAD(P)-dependent alcohol dehydrogenase [Phycisphaerae bacterium]|jgi:uncharacterized zinc-type alcohol dehydrogenase-like protein
MPTAAKAFAAQTATSPLAPFSFDRRDPRPQDVEIEILYCGVCHSDLHQARNEWGNSLYPMVPGHEIVGRVSRVGSSVTKFKAGDFAGVGCMVGSCRKCASCTEGLEQYCDSFPTWTYNSPDPLAPGQPTHGGYSDRIVVDEAFTLKVSPKANLAATAPLLCAGITTYSPLRHWKVGKGQRVAIVGLGGLGHMGVKFARAFGAQTVVITTSPSKVEDAKRLGAHEVIVSKDADQMAKNFRSFDFILDCVSAEHDINAYLNLLKRDSTLCLVGAPEKPMPVSAFSLLLPRRSFAGSGIGGIAETQEMLDFCAANNIVSDIEIIKIQDINKAYDRLLKGDVKYRFVIDCAALK